MEARHVIDAIVTQSTVLVSELATAAGIRAPLSRIADRVFLDLSRAIEAQGVSRKVAADMFGMALRTYQKKVNRLTQSVTEKDYTLWQAVLEYLQDRGTATRRQVFDRFSRDDELDLRAVLKDLIDSGMIYCSGKGDRAVYGPTSTEARRALMAYDAFESAVDQVWLSVHDHPDSTLSALCERLKLESELVESALENLVADGRVIRDDASDEPRFAISKFVIPVSAEQGWEVAVIDHFRAVTTAIATKLKLGALKAEARDICGGATLGFVVFPGHPYENEVYGLLRRVRAEVNELWEKVSGFNDEHPHDSPGKVKVWFYFGQNVQELDGEEDGPGRNLHDSK